MMTTKASEGHEPEVKAGNEMWTYRRFLRELESELAKRPESGPDICSETGPQTGSQTGLETGTKMGCQTKSRTEHQTESESGPDICSETGRTGISTYIIGKSEAGEPVLGFVFGFGPNTVTLAAGAHADEPAGPNTLYRLSLEMLRKEGMFVPLFSRYRFLVIPHLNPDGDAANRSWITRWPELPPFMSGMIRELPGRDIEFGYPQMREENRAASDFWLLHGPADVHFSLHGMQFSEGFLLLISDSWEARTRNWRRRYGAVMQEEGLEPHDHDRKGEKGFHYMGPGFTSTPKGTAMREYFQAKGDHATAEKFHDSSMEFQTRRNPDALCMVTELPLFLIRPSGCKGIPENYLRLREEWRRMRENKGEAGLSASIPAGAISPKGVVRPEETISPAGAVRPEETISPAGAVRPEETISPAGAVRPEETISPAGAVRPEETISPAGAARPEETISPAGAVRPEEFALRLQEQFDIRPLPLEKAMRLHRFTILSALELYESSPFFKKASPKTDM